ncbi:unknown protein [Seminavis robusta]|uniref:Uncharacterized protein n=1 Tax=Seminavis robusta TaxID=568900 RepID=A0A9N8ETY2_9STRA|nr:unknown protein [Seminavis robusta]|eukprot:Sro1955_g307710.1 n/a (269) ;mRNA; f:11014-11906
MFVGTTIDIACLMFMSTHIGSAFLSFLLPTRVLLDWAMQPQVAPPYVPKRLRRRPSAAKEAITRAIGAFSSVLLTLGSTTMLLYQLIDLSVRESMELTTVETKSKPSSDNLGDDPFLDQEDDDPEGPYSSKARGYSKHTKDVRMLWDITPPKDRSEPTTMQLFIRFLLLLKGGLEIAACEGNPLVAYQVVLLSLSSRINRSAVDHQYDSDSILIAIDNCSSRCITNSMADFIDKPTKVSVSVQGIGGSVMATFRGTVAVSTALVKSHE